MVRAQCERAVRARAMKWAEARRPSSPAIVGLGPPAQNAGLETQPSPPLGTLTLVSVTDRDTIAVRDGVRVLLLKSSGNVECVDAFFL